MSEDVEEQYRMYKRLCSEKSVSSKKMYDLSYASLVWKVVISVLAFFRVVEVVPKSRILAEHVINSTFTNWQIDFAIT